MSLEEDFLVAKVRELERRLKALEDAAAPKPRTAVRKTAAKPKPATGSAS